MTITEIKTLEDGSREVTGLEGTFIIYTSNPDAKDSQFANRVLTALPNDGGVLVPKDVEFSIKQSVKTYTA